MDLNTVSRMAGHADVSTTARYYRLGATVKKQVAGHLHVLYKP